MGDTLGPQEAFFFFGWTPKATAKVSADVETGTFITEFTANLK